MRKGKRFFKTFVLAAAFCAMSAVPCTSHASAVDVPRAASDNTFATASRINMGDTLNGSITETKDIIIISSSWTVPDVLVLI